MSEGARASKLDHFCQDDLLYVYNNVLAVSIFSFACLEKGDWAWVLNAIRDSTVEQTHTHTHKHTIS